METPEHPEIVYLPQQLPEPPELVRLNQRLRANEISLDWSNVQFDNVKPGQLDTLLQGLTLYEHGAYIDATDNAAISEALFPLIMEAFQRAESDPDATIRRPVGPQNYPTPALWTSSGSENEAESTIKRKWNPDRKTFVPDAPPPFIERPADDTTGTYRPPSRFLPIYEMPCDSDDGQSPTPTDLDMLRLRQAEMSQLPMLLQPLVDTYTHWIEEHVRDISRLAQDRLQSRTEEQRIIQHYYATFQRIQESIRLIRTDRKAAQAFTFMNQVMWLQFMHTPSVQKRPETNTPASPRRPAACNWHPFQLAFILLNIPALLDASSADRDTTYGALADLRWFPTGWSQTNAYLGLAAYTLGIRRLQERGRGSTIAAILHYTTCELTFHRFQRLATLICACEISRRVESATWGITPFRLGLPATLKLVDLLPCCPWCGSAIEIFPENTSGLSRGRIFIYCRNPKNECAFNRAQSNGEGLPFLIIEKDVQAFRPALLITMEA